MFTTYIIQSIKTHKFYIGQTQNLENRLKRHNNNETKSLKNRGPFIVILAKKYPTRSEAMKREKQIKSFKGGIQFKNLIKSSNCWDTEAVKRA